jgi:hypothetical protein
VSSFPSCHGSRQHGWDSRGTVIDSCESATNSFIAQSGPSQEARVGSRFGSPRSWEFFPEPWGRRKAQADSLNTAWRNKSFRAYADFMETHEFRAGIDRLLSIAGPWQQSGDKESEALAAGRRIAIMCSEAVWWRCHRSLIADDLKACGIAVYHIMSGTKQELHPYTSAARIVEGRLSYREADPQARLFSS